MNNQTLPLPNPADWCSTVGAARLLGLSHRTVCRMISDKRLIGYLPYGATPTPSNHILWMPEVRDMAAALRKARGGAG